MQEHHRRSIRLPGYDYAQPGAYFVTICTHQSEWFLGEVSDGVVRLSIYGKIAQAICQALPQHFAGIEIDTFVVMPNHIHVIIVILKSASDARPTDSRPKAPTIHGTDQGSLGAIIQNFKSVAARRINQVRRTPDTPVWQRNYYEHVIRNQADLERIRKYIAKNPLRWESDEGRGEAFPRVLAATADGLSDGMPWLTADSGRNASPLPKDTP